jgi:hypothetical protein
MAISHLRQPHLRQPHLRQPRHPSPRHPTPAVHPPKPLKRKTIGLVISGILMAGGAIAWAIGRSQQIDKIQQAEANLTQACLTNLAIEASVLDAAQQVDTATRQLRSVPQIPGFGSATAQAELLDSAPCIQRIKSTASVLQADKLSVSALQVTPATVLSSQDWQTLQGNLDRAIAILRSVPPDAATYPQAQAAIDRYQAKSTELTARLQNETGATSAYLRAVKLMQQADDLTRLPTSENLSNAETAVQEAIKLMQGIPAGTTISASQTVTLTDYQTKLTKIQQQWFSQQLTPLVEDFLTFATPLDPSMGYEEYDKQWKDLKAHFETQTQGSDILSRHPVTQALAIAVQQYEDARLLWRYCHDQNCRTSFQSGFFLDSPTILWLPETLDLQGKPLNQTYEIESTYSLLRQERLVQLNVALRRIWQDAEQQIQDAKAQIL